MKKQMFYSANAFIFQRAKELGNRLTNAEQILWMQLRTKPNGYKFRRQHPAGNYILDFYCHASKLAVEVDGNIHDRQENQKAHQKRQRNLESEGICAIRFSNKDVMTNMDAVLERIHIAIDKRLSLSGR